jgi:putative spermidine/putrescine transport system ATP-binding protein
VHQIRPSEFRDRSVVNTGAGVAYEAVAKDYGEITALHSTTLTIAPGEFFSLIGPSGSGKTTLLGVTAGFLPPSRGKVLVGGRDLVGVPAYRRNIGMVFQSYSLFPHMTVADNIAFPLRMRRFSRADQQAKVRRMLEMVRLGGMGDRFPRQLSGGQQQRVALARATIYDPLLLLMDEPLSALDKNLREEMQHEIKAFQALLATTVIYVTHDQHEAASMSERIAIMNGGRVVQIGTPRALYERPDSRFVAGFLGAANIFEIAKYEPQGQRTIVQTQEGFNLVSTERPPPGRFVVCVRPERIKVHGAKSEIANQLEGKVLDITYSAGVIHYTVDVGLGRTITQKSQIDGSEAQFERGQHVYVSWDGSGSQLVAD